MRALPFLVVLALGGCGDSSSTECRYGAECASGACNADGTCVPVDEDAGIDGSHALDDGGEGDAQSDAGLTDGGGRDDGGDPALCQPDGNGRIDRSEVPLAAGLRASFEVAFDAAVSMAGTADGEGRRWDLSGALEGDHLSLVETRSLEGTWFGPDFSGATYAARLSDTEDELGVFEVTGDALLLRGVVSPEDGFGRTEIAYEPPVTVLSFPFERGDSWTTESTASDVLVGIPVATERYDVQVDANGTVAVPYGEFPVLRIRVDLTRTVGFSATTIRTFLFVSECFGTVASVVSFEDEDEVEFTRAAEASRLAP
ncbi:MAG: hypothetical protein HYY06_02680 [Deltaproteobacteria bacterium]|nr:hypothetical protein [Deltaproteobacteria bacterium]